MNTKRSLAKLGILTFLITSTLNSNAEQPTIDLAKCGDWDIVVDTGASESEQYAAEEFQSLFKRATNIHLPIVSSSSQTERHFFVGAGKEMEASPIGFEVEGYGDEDFRIVVGKNNIAIAGGRPRGTLYGVYTFLEDYLGVRFLTHDHTHVPKVGKSQVIGTIDRKYQPPLGFRWSFYGENSSHPEFAVRAQSQHSH